MTTGGGGRDGRETGSPLAMIMSPTSSMTLPILDLNFYWHENVICFFHLTVSQIFTHNGSSDVTGWHRHIVLWRAKHSVPCIVWLLLLLWMTTDKWARYGVCSPFSCNLKPCIDHAKTTLLRTAFETVPATRLLTGIMLPKGGSKPDWIDVVFCSHSKASLVLIHKHLLCKKNLIWSQLRIIWHKLLSRGTCCGIVYVFSCFEGFKGQYTVNQPLYVWRVCAQVTPVLSHECGVEDWRCILCWLRAIGF